MKSKYFKIQELVSEEVYNKYGENAWQFIDEKLIYTIDTVREFFDEPIIVNNWLWGGTLKQRGLRANKDPLVANKKGYYISQHCLGKAVDFNVKDLTSEEVYNLILQNKDRFPYLKRIENIQYTPTWVHIDVANTNSDDLIIFNA